MKKTVLITGATSGIGLACARKFAANGDRLILTGRKPQLLEEIRNELTAKGTEVLTLVFDVSATARKPPSASRTYPLNGRTSMCW